jgi:(1->4)-alpha-D-glucan 1-alpha-D-glucosylmutase
MSALERLDHLAELAGIEPFYWDIWGNYHEIAEATKRSILATLGIAATDDAAVEASIRALEEESWRRPLPPVLVLRESETVRIPLALPVEAGGADIEWIVLEEGGTRWEGRLPPADGPPLEKRELGGRALERRFLELPVELSLGYHTLTLPALQGDSMPLIVVPPRCYLSEPLTEGRRQWGITAQLYSLRSQTNWGIGDLTDLGDLLEKAADLGATCVGINPLHALFLDDPELSSPYMPCSQIQLNPLYLDLVVVPDLAECSAARDLMGSAEFTAETARLREDEYVDYSSVTSLKVRVLELLYQSFRRIHLATNSLRAADFARFQAEGGEDLRRFALFQTLTESFGHRRWTEWPEDYRDPSSATVQRFARRNRERVEFFQYLQWQTDIQLEMACRRAEASRMTTGIYGDLSASVAPDGADAWARRDVIAQTGRIGAPPDPFNPLGQDWGSAPLHPHELRRSGYRHFIAVVRANMRYAGALRVDHVMGLQRMFWIPAGAFPESGAYVRYPIEDLLGILALESQRNRCVVIGEDLGTVPEGFRARMTEAGVLSYRVLYFEKDGDRFRRPDEYPPLSLASASTHDLPTLRGFMEGNDLALRSRHGLYPTEEARRKEGDARAHDRWLLLSTLDEEGLLPHGVNLDRIDHTAMLPAIIEAVHLYLARSRAGLFMIQLDDLFGEPEQVNLPGTVFERPNWRRKLSRNLDYLVDDTAPRALAKALKANCRNG